MVTGRGGDGCGCEALALHYRHLGLCRRKEQHSLGSMRKKSKTLPREVSLPKATSLPLVKCYLVGKMNIYIL